MLINLKYRLEIDYITYMVSKEIHFLPSNKSCDGKYIDRMCLARETSPCHYVNWKEPTQTEHVFAQWTISLSRELLCNLEIDPIIFASVATVQTATTCHTLFYLCYSGAS